MKIRLLFVAALVVGTVEWALAQQAVLTPVPYDTFCQLESAEKRRAFQAAAPEHKALLARTQMERFRDANQPRLTAPQLSLIKEMLAVAVPATFTKGQLTPEAAAKLESLEKEIAKVFSRDDQRAMDQYGPCIPTKVR